MSNITREQVEAVIDITMAFAEAIRELTAHKGGVPSGELYALAAMPAGLTIKEYGAILDALEGAALIDITNHWIKWTGPQAGQFVAPGASE